MARRYADADSADDLGRLDAEAIARVREEAWPRRAQRRRAARCADACSASSPTREAARDAGWRGWLAAARARRGARRGCRARRRAALLGRRRAPAAAAALHPGADAASRRSTRRPSSRARRGRATTRCASSLRGRLGGARPGDAPTRSRRRSGSPRATSTPRCSRCEAEGCVMRGRFTPRRAARRDEWCERRLLARIHRYTLKRLRARSSRSSRATSCASCSTGSASAPARARQRPGSAGRRARAARRLRGAGGGVGSRAPAGARRRLRLAWLDDLCPAGRTLWTRLRPPRRTARRGGGAPRARDADRCCCRAAQPPLWTRARAARRADDAALGSRAQRVADYLARARRVVLRRARRRRAPAAHRARRRAGRAGRARPRHCDSFAGLRALLLPPSKRASSSGAPARRGAALFGIEDAGRWALMRAPQPRARRRAGAQPTPTRVEHIARTLLRRYGVVFWRLLEREAGWLPPWRELLRVYRRLEARGEIRGGRFVAGLSGEQFALPEAVGAAARGARAARATARWSASPRADPLNLLGTRAAGPEGAALAGARVLYRDGVPVATLGRRAGRVARANRRRSAARGGSNAVARSGAARGRRDARCWAGLDVIASRITRNHSLRRSF